MTYPNLETERDTTGLRTSYTAFLLRCWLEETNGEAAWRFTLMQMGDGGSKQGFTSLEAVVDCIKRTLSALDHKLSGGKYP